MKKLYTVIIVCSLVVTSVQSYAQLSPLCGANRFHDFIYPIAPSVISDVVYGSNVKSDGTTQSLLMDIYPPGGDAATNRPLVIIAHGGSFVGGSKTGPDVVPLALDFAKLGYVAASIEYRLGMTNFPIGVDSADAGAAVMRGTHDGRAAVRFFRKNARVGGNTYGIDTNNIYFLGVSAGGFIALHLAYMDHINEFPNYIDTTGVTIGTSTGQPGLHGGIEGLSGNQGYPSTVKAIVNICGAIGDTAWIHTGDTPLLSFHGTVDGTVPYGYAEILLGGVIPLLRVYGSSTVNERATHQGVPNCMETWLGADHVPEVQTSTNTATFPLYFDSTITITRTFLEHFTCNTASNCNYTTSPVLSVDELTANLDFNVYPNPANTFSIVDLSAFNGKQVSIELFDALGRKVVNVENLKADKYLLNRNNMSSGIYFMNVVSEGKVYSKKIIFE